MPARKLRAQAEQGAPRRGRAQRLCRCAEPGPGRLSRSLPTERPRPNGMALGCAATHSPRDELTRPTKTHPASPQQGWRMPTNTVKVDRTTLFRQSVHAEQHGRTGAIRMFELWLDWKLPAGSFPDHAMLMTKRRWFSGASSSLRGKNLACWCRCPNRRARHLPRRRTAGTGQRLAAAAPACVGSPYHHLSGCTEDPMSARSFWLQPLSCCCRRATLFARTIVLRQHNLPPRRQERTASVSARSMTPRCRASPAM